MDGVDEVSCLKCATAARQSRGRKEWVRKRGFVVQWVIRLGIGGARPVLGFGGGTARERDGRCDRRMEMKAFNERISDAGL